MNPHPYGISPDGPLWQVFTFSFIHTDIWHLMLNCAALLVLWLMKPGSVFLKLAAVLAGPVLVGLIFREMMSGQSVMVGASIAVYSLLGLYAAPAGIRWRLVALFVLVLEPFTHPVAMGWHVMGFATGCTIYFATVATRMLTNNHG